MRLIKTGIAGLDEFLTGGLPPKILLLEGAPGTGNEVFARQVAYNRAKQVAVTYFVVNSTPGNIRDDMGIYNWDTQPLEVTGNWKFKAFPKTIGLQQVVLAEMAEHRTVIIDSLSELLLTRKLEEVTNLMTEMSDQNKDSEEYHLLLLTEGMQDKKTETTMQHFAEGVITFNITVTPDTSQTDLLIRKMKGAFTPNRRLPYTISKRGFLIETATRIT